MRRLDDDRYAAALGELDRIAGEVEQNLAQPRRVADHPRRQALVDIAADFEALCLGARPKQLDRLLDKGRERERPRREIEPAGFDLGEVENLLDQRQQRFPRGFHRFQIGLLLGGQRRVAEQIGHAENAVERRADLVRHHGEKTRLGAVGRLGLIARLGQRLFGEHAVGHVAADALHFAAAVGAHGDFAPGDPARAVGRGDFLVVRLRAVGRRRVSPCSSDWQRKVGREKVLARAAGQRAKRVVGVGDGAVAVAAHDDVVLRLEEARSALLRFA